MPVLDEEARVGGALRALARCGDEVAEIVVVDGGSRDATREVVARAAALDARIRWVDAPPAPPGWNNKAWNIASGIARTRAPWIATVDADVRTGPGVIADALARAARDGLDALSVATRQRLPDAVSAVLHPALLATLVYRPVCPTRSRAIPRTSRRTDKCSSHAATRSSARTLSPSRARRGAKT